jgi:hypothetical protein
MGTIFGNLSLSAVLAGNALASSIGLLFIGTAPVREDRRPLRRWLTSFWLLLVLYYLARLGVEQLTVREEFLAFTGPTRESDFRPFLAWIWLLVLSDLSSASLFYALGAHVYWKTKKRRVAAIILGCCFMAWATAGAINSAFASSSASFAMFLYVSWRERGTNIAHAMVWLSYAFLHLPLRGVFVTPGDWTVSVFILLIAAKLSLIPPMYAVLGVKTIKPEEHEVSA